MQYADLERDTLESHSDQTKQQEPLPILPGMRDAENQALRFDLPDEIINKLRNWR
jgi:hypothetical protein